MVMGRVRMGKRSFCLRPSEVKALARRFVSKIDAEELGRIIRQSGHKLAVRVEKTGQLEDRLPTSKELLEFIYNLVLSQIPHEGHFAGSVQRCGFIVHNRIIGMRGRQHEISMSFSVGKSGLESELSEICQRLKYRYRKPLQRKNHR